MSKFNEIKNKFFSEWGIPALAVSTVVLVVLVISMMVGHIDRQSYAVGIYRDNIELHYEGARAELVESIDLTIREVAPTTCMNGLAILRGCEKYGVDLFFVLAQGQLESQYGTKGMAQKTNSVFNVFAFDGHSYDQINKNGKYKHPDLSVEPYLKLLKEHYLVNGKTELDLMVNYVNEKGDRYATADQYEYYLMGIYNRLINNDTLQAAWKKYNQFKILSGN